MVMKMSDLIDRQAAIDALGDMVMNWTDSDYELGQLNQWKEDRKAIIDLPSAQPEPCEDVVPRMSVEYICRKNTVSTNPYEHKYHDKFIQFMDDPEISDFGRWQHSNGFNTALVAVECDLDKVPSAQPQRWIPVTERLPEEDVEVLITYRYKEGEGDTSHAYIDITTYGQMYFGGNKVGDHKHWRQPFEYFTSNYEVVAWMPLPEPYKGGQDALN